jgi:hypothetical protein
VDEEARRKLQAKRLNEHIKLLMTTVNAAALIVLGAGVLQPLVASAANRALSGPGTWVWIALGVTLHLLAQALIRFIRSE